jgi:hypothetical protein
MAEDNSAGNSDKIHKDNSAKVAAQVTANAAKAATVPPNVGRTEPALDVRIMQGSANGVVPNWALTVR